jgi:hypothetical protein
LSKKLDDELNEKQRALSLIQEKENHIATQDNEQHILREELSKTIKDLQDQQQSAESLRSLLDNTKKEIQNYKDIVSSQTAELEKQVAQTELLKLNFTEELEMQASATKQLEELVKFNQTKASELTSKNQTLEQICVESKEENSKLRDELQTLREMLDREQREHRNHILEVSKVKDEADKLHNQLLIEREANAKLQEQWSLQRDLAEKAKKQYDAVYIELRVKDEELSRKETELKKSQSHLGMTLHQAELESVASLKATIKAKDDELKSFQKQMKKAQKELEMRDSELHTLRGTVEMYFKFKGCY